MARVFFHIGAHKTGTSYLQATFYQNRDLLKAHGIHYPAFAPHRAHHELAAPWMTAPGVAEDFFDQITPDAFWDKLVAEHAGLDGTLFLSSENFCRMDPRPVDMADLARRLQPFEEIRIVYTLRQPTALLSSVWSQVAKMRTTPPAMDRFLRKIFRQGIAAGVQLDHQVVYDHLRKGFSPEQIVLLDYDTISKGPGGIVQAFLDLLDCDLDPGRLSPVARQLANVSPDPLALYLATRIWPGVVPDPVRVARIGQALTATGQPTTLLSREEYVQVGDRFRASNQALAEMVREQRPEFVLTETPPPENLLYRDGVDEAVWLRIAAALYDAPPPVPERRSLLTRLRQGVRRRIDAQLGQD